MGVAHVLHQQLSDLDAVRNFLSKDKDLTIFEKDITSVLEQYNGELLVEHNAAGTWFDTDLKKPVLEASKRVIFKTEDNAQAKKIAASLGKKWGQQGVYLAKYGSSAKGFEYAIQFEDIKQAQDIIKRQNEFGFGGSAFNLDNDTIYFGDQDGSNKENFKKLLTDLRNNNVKYQAKWRKADIEFITSEQYDSVLDESTQEKYQIGNGPSIKKAEKLNKEHRQIEQNFAKQILSNPDKAVDDYLKDNSNILNTDLARELSPDYSKDKASRSLYSAAIHEPASWLVKEIFKRITSGELKPKNDGEFIFTGGGTGAGKSSAINHIGSESKHLAKASWIYDTNLNNFRKAKQKIDAVLKSGQKARIYFVYRDPISAFHGAIGRSSRMGRTVPIEEHIKTHVGVVNTVRKLKKEYKGNPNVKIVIINNEKGYKEKAGFSDTTIFKDIDVKQLETKLHNLLWTHKELGHINEEQFQGFRGNSKIATPPEKHSKEVKKRWKEFRHKIRFDRRLKKDIESLENNPNRKKMGDTEYLLSRGPKPYL